MTDPPDVRARGGHPEPIRALQQLVAGVVLLEGLLVAGAAVALAVATVRDPNEHVPASVGVVLVALVIGGALAWCARGVLDGARWSRGPVVTWQLVQAGVAMPLVLSNAWWLGVPLFVVGVLMAGLVAGGRVVSRERY